MRIAVALAAFWRGTILAAEPLADAEQRAEAREIYARAIAFKTSASGGEVPQFAQYLRQLFLEAGIPAADTLIVPFDNTASLLVRHRGDGTGGRAIALLAHMDVVEARREDWERDPFTLIEENGFFFGRGSADNKAGLVALASTLLRFKREGFTPTRDLVLVFTGDEEVAQLTVQDLLRNHREWLNAEFVLNSDSGYGALDETSGQPFVYYLRTAEKAFASYRLTVRNPGGHSRAPRPDNAIYDLAAALMRIRPHQFPVRWNETTIAAFGAEGALRHDEFGLAMRRFARRPGDRSAAATLSKQPFFNGLLRTTCVPTLLAGGHADNALPQSASATINCRLFPGDQIVDVRHQLQQLAGDGVEVELTGEPYSSDASALREDVLQAVRAAVHTSYPEVAVVPSMTLGSSDSLFFVAAGIPAYGTGETFMKDSDDFSHGLNERLPVDSFYRGLTHWRVLLTELSGRR